MVTFGDVFTVNGAKYVYLTESDGVLYAAKVITPEQVQMIERTLMKNGASPTGKHRNDNHLYCFVRLTTAQFEDHGAHLGKTDDPAVRNPFGVFAALNREDRETLLTEILGDSESAVPGPVKDAARELREPRGE